MVTGSRWIGRSAGDVINGDEAANSLTSPDRAAGPPSKKLFFKARKVNAATKTMPEPVIQTGTGKAFQTPTRLVISAADPLNSGIADDEFQVALSQGHTCGINNSDHGQNRDPSTPHLETLREKIHRDAQPAVGSEFHHNSGEQHRTRSRRGHVAGWRPGVQGPD